MIKHIVMWKLKEHAENNDRETNAKLMKEKLEALKNDIKEIQKIEVGININSSDAAYDVVLYSEFNSMDDLKAYIVHPKHEDAAAFVGNVRESRVVVDYEV